MILAKIMLINLVLSGDNAVIIAMASRNLPEHQRKAAIWWGAVGAVVLRIVLVFAALLLLRVPYLQAAGAMLLMYIAIKLLDDDGNAHSDVREAKGLWQAVWTIMAADFIMSLDNVLAIAAIAKGHVVLVMIGVMLSIPLIIWGSSLVVKLLIRFPVLSYAGAAILGYTAGEMLLGDPRLGRWISLMPQHVHVTVPLVCMAFALVPGFLKLRGGR
jgi:YjbE family integral membrane protein